MFKNHHTIRFLLSFIAKQKFGFAILFCACIVNGLSASLWPYITGEIVDKLHQYTGSKSDFFISFKHLFLTAVGFWILVEALTRLRGIMMANVLPKMEAHMRINVFSKVIKHSHRYFLHHKVGEIANKIGDIPRAANMIIDVISTIFIPLVIALIISSTIFANLNITIACILTTWLTLHIFLNVYFCSKASDLSRTQSRARSKVQGSIVDTLNNSLVVKLFSSYSREIGFAYELQEDERRKHKQTWYFIEFVKFILGCLGFCALIIIFYNTISLWQRDVITVGNVVLILSSILNLWDLLLVATDEMTYLFKDSGVLRQGLEVLQDEDNVECSSGKQNITISTGEIEFKNVTFRYRNNDNIFFNKSLKILGGQRIGLVGHSGSGKTTFAKLILRLFNIESGSILIDGQDIANVNLSSLREQIVFVPQEPQMFHRTIAENICYGDENITFEDMIEATKKARCHEFITELEDGYNTDIGEKGGKVSGGQKQRIVIARSILKDAPIIILDEATSALDTVTERKIQESLDALTENKTTIIIAHRLSTLMNVDRILVFDKGAIVEDGTHAELIIKNGHYKRLWEMQNQGFIV